MEADFSGWATKNNIRCSDGRTIMGGAFQHQDKKKVPLVWQHQHDAPANILGHAILEHRDGGVYTYGFFNDTSAADNARKLVKHGDISSLSIYANNLSQQGKNVMHGDIKEVSLVLSGANPGAFIDNINIVHGDNVETLVDEAVIYNDSEQLDLEHSDTIEVTPEEPKVDDEPAEDEGSQELDIPEVFDTLDEDQQAAVHYMISEALVHSDEGSGDEPIDVSSIFDTLDDDQQLVVHHLLSEALVHAANSEGDTKVADSTDTKDKTVKEIFDAMTEEQKNVVYYLLGNAVDGEGDSSGDTAKHSDFDIESLTADVSTNIIKHMEDSGMVTRNVFEQNGSSEGAAKRTLSHSELKTIVDDAQKLGSFKESILAHAAEYGIEDIDILFPDAKALANSPEVIGRRTEWVADVINGTKHSPFSRIKSTAVDLTADEARAKGYVKGNLKKEEIIKLLKRVTTPTTIYKKQKLDRDDIIDITDLDVVAWLKAEMRLMLDEELARAVLIGDGRESDDEDAIDTDHLRPIAYDNDMYAHSITIGNDLTGESIVNAILRARRFYKGTGTPTLYTTDATLTDLILQNDKVGRRLYPTEAELAAALRVDKIVTVEVMDDSPEIVAIIVNLADYTLGADNGGNVSLFDDFDIDYNQFKYLIETRVSGALTKPKSALIIKRTIGISAVPQTPSYNGTTHKITLPAQAGVVWSVEGVDKTGEVTITQTSEVEARPATGYSFPAGTNRTWVYTV